MTLLVFFGECFLGVTIDCVEHASSVEYFS